MRFKVGRTLLVFALAVIGTACTNLALFPGTNIGSGSPTPTSIALTPNPAPALTVGGSTQQFTATGTFKSGGTQDLTSASTWTSSNTAIATISKTGVVTPVAPGTTNITAADSGITSPPVAVTVNNPSLSSVVVTPLGPGVAIGGTSQLKAMAYYTNNTSKDVTTSATWSSSSSSVASVGSATGLVTGVAAGSVTITAKYSSVPGSTAVNVVSTAYASNSSIKGDYVFTINDVDSRGPQYFLGHFAADGNGNITAGVMDYNIKGSASTSPATITGTYSVMPDGRGTMTLNSSVLPAGASKSITLRFVLSETLTTGQFIEFDGLGNAYGSFQQQTLITTLAGGYYVYKLTGIDANNNSVGRVGLLFDNAGMFDPSASIEDVNDFGVINNSTGAPLSVSGTISAFDGNGRATISLSLYSGTLNLAAYELSSSKILLISTDTTSAYSGSAEAQTGAGTFSNANFNGDFGFLIDRPATQSQGAFYTAGSVGFVGNASSCAVTSGGVQDNVTGGTNFQTISGGLCDIASNGRATVSETIQGSSAALPYVYYMVSNSGGSIQRAYVLETVDSSAAVGFADIQNSPGLSGTYAFVGADLASPGTVAGMLLHSTPNGSGGGALFGIADVGNAGMLESVAVTGSYATASSQRTSVTLSPVAGAQSYVFYLVTGSEFLGLGVTPALDGTGSLQ